MKKKLSLQWRLTLISMALVATACILLTLLLNRSALLQFDQIEQTVVQITTGDNSSLTMDVSLKDVIPDLSIQLQESRTDLIIHSLIAMAAVILAVGGCTYFFVGHALRPLHQLSNRMETVQAQNLSQPLNVPVTGDELSRLALSFNSMLSRLNASFETQRQFSANAAHELRTPLAVVQTQLEVLTRYPHPSEKQYSETFSQVCEQISRLEQLVQSLLEMTQLETAERSDHVSLSPMIEEVLCDLTTVADQKQVKLMQAKGDAHIIGNDLLLYRAVYNLVENAIKYNRSGGLVTVGCTQTSKEVVIYVTDTGIGIPKENWETIFCPFIRVDKSRSRKMGGAGLGLALVRRIAEEHGGTVFIVHSSECGTEIKLQFPLH